MSAQYVGAIDQGTSSTRFCIVNHAGKMVAQHQIEHKQIYPEPGWVEHDPMEIWNNTKKCVTGALKKAKLTAADLVSVGITNQRETTVVWDPKTGKPYHNAIVWNCARTAKLANEYAAKLGGLDGLRATTGLPIVSYFSALKLVWLLEQVPDLRAKALNGQVLFGTMDTWLLWKLSNGQAHVTDVTNASRTLLFNLTTMTWDHKLLEAFNIPKQILPVIKASSELHCTGHASSVLPQVAMAGILGDQHAALFGQACFAPGEAKCTYGTGCFIMLNTGAEPMPSKRGLLTTVAYQLKGQPPVYALEGAVMVCGSLIQWLRDQLRLIESADETEQLALDCGAGGAEGVMFVPAFAGLFAPHWREDARGTLCGLTAFHERKHVVKAALDAAAFQAYEVLEAMQGDSGVALASLKVDGGMTANNVLLQFQADIANVGVSKPQIAETTALGAAYAAGLAVGFWQSTDELQAKWQEEKAWQPSMPSSQRAELLSQWRKAVSNSLNWVDPNGKSDNDGSSNAPSSEEVSVNLPGGRSGGGLVRSRSRQLLDALLGEKNAVTHFFFDDDHQDPAVALASSVGGHEHGSSSGGGGGAAAAANSGSANANAKPWNFFDDDNQDPATIAAAAATKGRKRQAVARAVRRVDSAARQVPPLLLLAAGALGGMAAAKYLGRR